MVIVSKIITFLALQFVADSSLRTVKQAFKNAKLPHTLGIEFKPKALLDVVFLADTSKPPIDVIAGMAVLKNDTSTQPSFSVTFPGKRVIPPEYGSGPFVVTVLDPDAPSPQNTSWAQVRHFLAGNFYFEFGASGPQLVNKTPAVSDWKAPSPPEGSDAHKYAFLLYKQSPEFNDQTLVNSSTPIKNFNISQFAVATGLGQPIAGTFILVAP
ncbi:PEBP-like protein [Crepidotus variabilis]|uniref:PEBP-like protein n=1 Tax=Crepidotus variabilis TaxID=179855 RepID=A0A9P6E554_9AGAR|nr:PEBP-like protein [Crepidotus variabilis]